MCPLALYGVLSNQNECDEMRCVQSFMLALSYNNNNNNKTGKHRIGLHKKGGRDHTGWIPVPVLSSQWMLNQATTRR